MESTTFESQVEQWFRRHLAGPESLEERLRRFWSYRKVLYWKAADMFEKGRMYQYREFGVGAAALAFRPDRFLWAGGRADFIGYNSKAGPNGPKCCAERMLFAKAFEEGYRQIVGLVVVAEYQPDDTSGHICTTLHPCHGCRVMMREHPLAWPDMPVLTALPPPIDVIDWDSWTPVHEWHTLGEILEIHRDTASNR